MQFPRASGVLLHITSLPGPYGSGDFGRAAYQFVDWLVSAGQRLWQILPLNGIGLGNSPYSSTSAFAGNVLLIDLAELRERGWLEEADLVPETNFSNEHVNFAAVVPYRMARLVTAWTRFQASATSAELKDLADFCERQSSWLPDYALYMCLAEHYGNQNWTHWPQPLARREPAVIAATVSNHAEKMKFWGFCQWCFWKQCQKLKAYANKCGVHIIGDTPIFIAHDSADVWARPELFELDTDGQCSVVAGVPPDAFSTTGQRWGNPLYQWDAHANENYRWWVDRIRRTFELVDIVRLDHFRGFVDYWEVPAAAENAVNGRWRLGPNSALFEAIEKSLGQVCVIAEDPGEIIPAVETLRKQFELPSMRILQFAFDSDGNNRFLPHNHERDVVVYTGTHDNDTTQGWWAQISEDKRDRVRKYLDIDGLDIHWQLIRTACASVANTAIHPMQDVLGLGTEARMNFPGKPEGHWEWRFSWEQVMPMHAQSMKALSEVYNR